MFYAIVEKFGMEYVVETHDKVSDAIISLENNYNSETHEIVAIED